MSRKMIRESHSFSQRIKDELSQAPCLGDCCRQVELATAFWAAGKNGDQRVDVSTGHAGYAARLADTVRQHHHLEPIVRHGKEYTTLRLDRAVFADRIRHDIHTVFLAKGRQDPMIWPMCCRQALLRALYLVCGSVSEPATAYHMELAVRRDNKAAETLKQLLDRQDFRSTLVRRQHYHVICLREGQYLSDYLLLSGAHQSMLTFESLRVEKEMRNSVNRVVNCDNANLQRVADAAARQSELLRALQAEALDRQLPADLRQAAEVRLDNPELSLKELGERMQPPLGKSGMNHRLKRFESLADELLSRKER